MQIETHGAGETGVAWENGRVLGAMAPKSGHRIG